MKSKFTSSCSIGRGDSIISAADLGLVSEKIAFNGWYHDVAEIRGLYAPPYFSDDFRLKLRFDGKTVGADDYTWAPDCLVRRGRMGKWRFSGTSSPTAFGRGILMKLEVSNTSAETKKLDVQVEISGGLGKHFHWEFAKPTCAPSANHAFDGGLFSLSGDGAAVVLGSSLPLSPRMPLCAGLIDAPPLVVSPKGKVVFYTVLAVGEAAEAAVSAREWLADPAHQMDLARRHWEKRVDGLFRKIPRFSCDNREYERLYDRSVMHFLMNEWDVPEFLLRPYYSTGSINGGCLCCYLWNYGEPFRLWSMLDAKAAREHLKVFLRLDLSSCFAFHPEDGSTFGPYYPVNQEKVIFLAYAYVMQTGNTAFLREEVNGKTIIRHLIDQAVMHDDLSRDAVLVDYGNGNHHLELRRNLRYDGILPDLNLRRCVNYRLVGKMCRLAGVTPPCNMEKRAEAIRDLVHRELYSPEAGWFYAEDRNGKYLRWTMQLFKVLGWGDWTLTPASSAFLRKHLFDGSEFLGQYGIHSLSKKDPAYDEKDIDNGGPGACISFAPAIADRLYAEGFDEEGDEILKRLLWLGSSMPYWGDSHRADVREYRRDTPLQSDIQGTALAQTVIFGVFGIRVQDDFSVIVRPHLPPEVHEMTLAGVRLQGRVFDVKCRPECFEVICGGRGRSAKYGESIRVWEKGANTPSEESRHS